MGLKLQVMSALTFAKFLTRISNVMFLYKRYPKKADFECVAKQIVTRYPFMVSPLERAVSIESFVTIITLAIITLFTSYQGHITKTLQRRFREFRRERPETKEGDTKVKFAFKGATPSRKRKDKCDFQVPDGEDEVSFGRHNK